LALTKLVKREKVELLETMLRMRLFEERILKEIKAGNLEIGFHLLEGHEATVAGVCAGLRSDDYVTSNHRSLGRYLSRGGDMNKLMAEIFGKATGICRGKAGEMLFSDFSVGHAFTSVTVGAGIPVAVGIGLAIKLRMKTDQVVVSFFGDAATTNASFHESLNLAAVQKAPVIFVCENNGMSINVPQAEYMSTRTVGEKGVAYGIEGLVIDGTDPEAVLVAASHAVKKARRGGGPTLIDAQVVRLRPHKEGLADTRSKEELIASRRKDPVLRYTRALYKERAITLEQERGIRREIEDEVGKAVDFARASPYPAESEIFKDLYSDEMNAAFRYLR